MAATSMPTPPPHALRESSLDELRKEPWRLQIQAENAAEQLRNLVLKNYHLFIQSNQSSAVVKDDLVQLKREAEEVVAAIPELKAHCAGFQEEVADAVAKHGDIQFVFEHYPQLTELLDIPQLLEACIHNELFDSALDVVQFAHETFQAREEHAAAPNFVIVTLVREVAQMTAMMREKLLQKLREDLQLALCVRVVGYLRRLDALGVAQSSASALSPVGTPEYERQLKEEFLSCRNVWLASLSRSVSAADPYHYTVQLIDIKRTSWFDMITQYSAIFGSETVDGKVDPPLCRWATTTVADFIQILMKQLPKIDDFSSLATVLEQSLFFGGSLGRVGVDFRAILVVHFEDHVLELMGQQWRAACRAFQESLGAHALASSGSAAPFAKTPIALATSHPRSATATGSSPFPLRAAASGEDYSPPHALMAFPIVAEFTNAMLASLNELRLCTIASLQPRLAKKLQHAICTLLLAISEFCEDNKLRIAETTMTTRAEAGSKDASSDTKQQPSGASASSKRQTLSDALSRTVEMLRKELIPYLIKCFHRLYPNRALSGTLLDVEYFEEIMRETGLIPLQEQEISSVAAVSTTQASADTAESCEAGT